MLLGALTNIAVICMTHRPVFQYVRHNIPLAIDRMSAVSLLVTGNVQNVMCSSQPEWTLIIRQDSCIFRLYKRKRWRNIPNLAERAIFVVDCHYTDMNHSLQMFVTHCEFARVTSMKQILMYLLIILRINKESVSKSQNLFIFKILLQF